MDCVAIRRPVHTQGDLKVPSHRCRYTYVQLQSSAKIVLIHLVHASPFRWSDGKGRASAAQQASVAPLSVTGVLAHKFGGPESALKDASGVVGVALV